MYMYIEKKRKKSEVKEEESLYFHTAHSYVDKNVYISNAYNGYFVSI